jgi:hypothetical protein
MKKIRFGEKDRGQNRIYTRQPRGFRRELRSFPACAPFHASHLPLLEDQTMLTFWGRKQTSTYAGVSRREFLRIGTLGLGGLSIADLLRLEAQGSIDAHRSKKAVIMVYLYGGMPQQDMYDMKPEAPAELRGEFKPIQTTVPGIQVCELLPKHAAIMDKLAIIRNWEGRGGHDSHELVSGYVVQAGEMRPAFGSVVSRLRGAIVDGMPQYVATNKYVAGITSYLGKAHEPFMPSGDMMKNLTLNVPADQLADRKTLLQSFDTLQRNLVTANESMSGIDALTARALDMVTSNKVRDALDISGEMQTVRARYGKSTSWLQALRLVESGVSVVSLDGGLDSFDTHEKNYPRLRKLLPDLDEKIHALVTDLHERGLERDVTLVVWSEFGRTPKINNLAGRDHHPTGSVLMAGGGLKMGQAIGATDANADKVIGTPYRATHVLATLYGVLGIDPATTLPDFSNRPMYLLDDRQTIKELE